jgi:CubicO group peptidase (beta-lactamase class C family)
MRHTYRVHSQDTYLRQEYLSKIISKVRKKYDHPAVAVSVMNSKIVLLQEVQGKRVFDKQDQATSNDYFHIGSCSKSVLAVMAAKLIEQKKITWNTGFFDIFPELKASANSAYYYISLKDLLLCEAGIKAYINAESEPLPKYGHSINENRLEFIKHLIGLTPSSKKQHGRFQHLYSNASYTLVAAMLEKVSDQRYEELVKKTLIDGLGMSVHIGWPNSISPNQPWGHLLSKGEIRTFPPDHRYKLPCLITPAGDLSMTVKDYANYTQLHLQGLRGSDNYISSEAYRYIHFGHISFSLGVANGVLGGKRYSGFDGSAGTFFCRSIIVPDSDFAFTIMTNAGSGSESSETVDRLTLQIVKRRFNWWWKFWL